MGMSAYTMISMADKTLKRAEDLAVGDSVLNPATGGSAAVTRVLNSPGVGMTGITGGNGSVLHVTGDHMIQSGAAMLPAEHIRPGSKLTSASGEIPCTEASPLPGDFMVYDIKLDNASSLFANGFVVGM